MRDCCAGPGLFHAISTFCDTSVLQNVKITWKIPSYWHIFTSPWTLVLNLCTLPWNYCGTFCVPRHNGDMPSVGPTISWVFSSLSGYQVFHRKYENRELEMKICPPQIPHVHSDTCMLGTSVLVNIRILSWLLPQSWKYEYRKVPNSNPCFNKYRDSDGVGVEGPQQMRQEGTLPTYLFQHTAMQSLLSSLGCIHHQ